MHPRRTAVRAVVGLAVVLASAPPALATELPERGAEASRPVLDAGSAIVVDAATGETLYARAAGRRRAIASATKLMTALLALERADPRDVFTAPAYDASPIESKIDLRRGERLTVADLLRALLLESANDAAVAIAVNVSGSRAAFVRQMNRRARELGLRDTSFANPIGLDAPRNYSTALDLATLARRLMRERRFRAVVDLPRAVLRSGARRRVVTNRNRLVARYPFVDGVKTGRTREAGFVLVGSATGRGKRVISVVLDEPSEGARDIDTLRLLRYGLDRFRRVPALRRGEVLARAEIKHRDDQAALVAPRTMAVTVRVGERVERRVSAPEEVEGPLPRGARVGSVALLYRGRVAARSALVTAEAVPEAGVLRRLSASLGLSLTLIAIIAIVSGGGLMALRLRVVRRQRARTT